MDTVTAIIILVIIVIAFYSAYLIYSKGKACLTDPINCLVGKNPLGDIAADAKTILTNAPKQLGCPSNLQSNGASLCYDKCPPGYNWDGAQLCYKACPSDWKGKSTLMGCLKDTKYSSVGTGGTDKYCDPGKVRSPDNQLGLCYSLPDPSWEVTSPGFIGKKCPSGTNNSGTTCWYDRGVGKVPNASCPPGWNLTNAGVLSTCYIPGATIDLRAASDAYWWSTRDRCTSNTKVSCHQAWSAQDWANKFFVDCNAYPPLRDQGFRDRVTAGGNYWQYCDRAPQVTGANIYCDPGYELKDGLCYPAPRPGFTCTATNCSMSKNITSQVGTIPTNCPPGKELGPGVGNARLCYPTCNSGYERTSGDTEHCSEKCPPGYNDIGIAGCAKPTKTLGVAKSVQDVGVCPIGTKRIGMFCY